MQKYPGKPLYRVKKLWYTYIQSIHSALIIRERLF